MAPVQVGSHRICVHVGEKFASAAEDADSIVCRFCLGDETEGGEFVQPCPCRGSSKYVHMECLEHAFVARGEWHNFRCPTCHQPYTGRALLTLAEMSRSRMSARHGDDAPQVAYSLCYLAQAHAQLGDAKTSKELLEKGLSIAEKKFGRGHVATAATLAELASAYGKLGDLKTQKDLLERSLEIKEQHFGPGHINTAVTLNNLATVHSELGDVVKEKALVERSLEIKELHYGKGHVQTTAAIVNLAGVYGELGDVVKAQELLEWSLTIEQRHFGVGDVETAITLNNLALASGENGNLERMKELLLMSLEIKEKHYGMNHQELCLTLANLGLACASLKQHSEAQAFCERALRVLDLPDAPCSSRRQGVVLLRVASVYIALESLQERVSANGLFLMARSRSTLTEALGPAASSRVLSLEGVRMGRIWSAADRADVKQRLSEELPPPPVTMH